MSVKIPARLTDMIRASYKDEKDYKKKIVAAMRARYFDVQEHEDKFSRYIPDVSFAGGRVDGWLEVKYFSHIPKKLSEAKHITPGQIEWGIKRSDKGSNLCFFMIAIHDVGHLLIPARRMREALDDEFWVTCGHYFAGDDLPAAISRLEYMVSEARACR